MEKFSGPEKRKHPRLNVNFIVSYRVEGPSSPFDLSQTKDVSQGGLLLTTNKKFDKGTILVMTILFPFVEEKMKLTGIVVDSQEKVRDLIYETHIQFKEADESLLKEIGEFIQKKVKSNA